MCQVENLFRKYKLRRKELLAGYQREESDESESGEETTLNNGADVVTSRR